MSNRTISSIAGLITLISLVTGCGGSSSSDAGGSTTPLPTVIVSASPATITLGQSSTLTVTTTGATSCAGSTGLSASVTCNGTISVTPSATGSYSYGVTATGTGGSATASATVTVNAVPPTVTSITISCLPASITTVQTTNCAATVAGTGAFSTGVSWSATNGSITAAGVFAPSGAGTATITATSTQSGYTSVSGTASVVVTTPAPTVTSVTVIATPSSITTAQTSQCSATVVGTGAYTSAVTWSATNGTITTGGLLTPAAAGTSTCTATSKQSGYTGISGSANVTVTLPPAIMVACTPSAITTADTAQCTATYQNLGPGVNWTVAGSVGTISATGLYTPPTTASGTLTPIITATSTQTGFTTVSGSAQVSVTEATPQITSSNFPSMYCDATCGIISNIHLNGSGFQVGDAIGSTPAGIASAALTSSTLILETLNGDTPHSSPGWITTTIISSDGNKSASWSIPFIGNQNSLALSASGELNSYDRVTGYIWNFKPDGTADGSNLQNGAEPAIAIDDTTGYTIYSQQSGNSVIAINGPAGLTNGNPAMGIAARNGIGCTTQPSVNDLSCFDLTQSSPTFNSVNTVGSQPWSLAMGLFGTETDAFVFSRDGTPTLWKANVSGATPVVTASQPITGVTPVANVQVLTGGWQVVVFDSGPASGTVAVLSAADNLVTFFNASTLAITRQVTLTGLPFRIAADLTNGNLIVAYADATDVLTTFAKINPATGTVTPLTSTSALLAVGFAVKADGTSLYACQRAACEIHPNQ